MRTRSQGSNVSHPRRARGNEVKPVPSKKRNVNREPGRRRQAAKIGEVGETGKLVKRSKNPLGLPEYDEEISDELDEQLVTALDELDEQSQESAEDKERDVDDGNDDISNDDNDEEDPPDDISFQHSKQVTLQSKKLISEQLHRDKEKRKDKEREKKQKLEENRIGSSKYISSEVLARLTGKMEAAVTTGQSMRQTEEGAAPRGEGATENDLSTPESSPASAIQSRYNVVDMSNTSSLLPKSSMEKAREFKLTMMNRMKRQTSSSLLRHRMKQKQCPGLTIASASAR